MSASKPLPTLSHMPWNVKKLISASADSATKLPLRQCSKEFKCFVDRTTLVCQSFCIDLDKTRITTTFRLSGSHVSTSSFPVELFSTQIVSDECIRESVDYIVRVMERTNMFLKCLNIKFCDSTEVVYKFMLCLRESLALLDHLLRIKKIHLEFEGSSSNMCVISDILPHLEPGTLETLRFDSNLLRGRTQLLALQSVIGMSQWRQAKQLHMNGFLTDLPEQELQHFDIFSVNIMHLTLDRAKGIVEKAMQNRNFKKQYLMFRTLDKEDLDAYYRQMQGRMFKKISIPGTQEHLVVRLTDYIFSVQRRTNFAYY